MYRKKISMLTSLLLSTIFSWAQQAPAAASPAPVSRINNTELLLIAVILILAFVIYGMGQVLYTLGHQLMQKEKGGGKAMTIIMMIAGLSLLSMQADAQATTAAVDASVPAVNTYGDLSPGVFWLFISIIGLEFIAILFMMYGIRNLQQELLPAKAPRANRFAEWWSGIDRKFFTKAVAIEKEADVLLDHDYDGIRELDNALPPWWKWGFYVSIVAGVIYMFHFHVLGTGLNPTEEYMAEMESARIRIEEYNSLQADRVDEKNIQMPATAGIAKGQELFAANCWACHGRQGEGGTGPNLTDDYWIHKGSLTDIYHSIKTGYPDKGMQSWEKNFSPKEITYLAGFVKSLRGTNPPNPKPPQGDLFAEEAAAAGGVDSTKVKADSTAAKK